MKTDLHARSTLNRAGWMLAAGLLALCACAMARADAIDDYIGAQMRKQHIAGLSLAVVKDGKPVKLQGYGTANLEWNTAVTAETVFKIGSVSKQFIASGVMLLVNDGKVSLDDSIVKYLEGAPPSWNAITVRHALSHTSGLVREAPGFDAFKLQADAEVIKSAYAVALKFQPGEKFEYCNLGYFILAEIIHKTSGKPWPEFMEERVFKPAQMPATRTTAVAAVIRNRADGYWFKDGEQYNATQYIALRPSGAFLSTVADLVKWNAALDSGSVLPRATLELMWTPVLLNSGEAAPYGFGWFIEPSAGHRRIHHGGSLPGFRAEFARFPDDNLSVIVLANGDAAQTDVIALGVAAQFVPELLPKRAAVRVGQRVLDAYAGRYVPRPNSMFTITRVGDELLLVSDSGVEMTLAPLSATRFFWTDSPGTEFSFVKAAGGDWQLTMQNDGVEQLKAARVP